jgi:hypothetical protein
VPGRHRGATNAMETITARDEIAIHRVLLAVKAEPDGRTPGFESGDRDVTHFEVQRPTRRATGRNEVFDDLVLPIDRDGAATRECLEIDPMTAAAKAEINPAVAHAFPLQAIADAGLDHEVDGALLEHTRAYALDDVVAGAVFDYEGFDPVEVKQVAEHEPCGTCSHDADLRSMTDHACERETVII